MVSQKSDWPNIAGLLSPTTGTIGMLGAPMVLGCVTPGQTDKAPGIVRKTLSRISTYDLETGTDLQDMSIRDFGDVDIAGLSPGDGFASLKSAFANVCQNSELSILLGGHNGVTRPGVHGLDASLQSVGLLTLDAHFDLRSTANGMMNGNPVRALLEDGLPGQNIAQIGLAPFANTAQMHQTALKAGIAVYTMADCRAHGLLAVIETALRTLSSRCDKVYVDFDIDVIDRAQSPGAPGGRSGGISTTGFFAATRYLASQPIVKAVDLTEFDPALDVSDITALIAARWVAELLAGFSLRLTD